MQTSTQHVRTAARWAALTLAIAAIGCGSSSNTNTTSPTTPGTGTGTGSAGGRGPSLVTLGTSSTFAILAQSAISNTPTSAITGNIGISPAAASLLTGFALTLPAGGASSTSTQVTGSVFAADYAVPTPANLTAATAAVIAAYGDAAGRTSPDYTNLGSGNLGGLTLPAGLYKWSSAVTIPTDLTLNGNANDTWILQVSGTLTQASATRVNLTGGALPQNVFWVVSGVVSLGTTAHMEGQVLSQTAITLGTGASVTGRLLAQTAVTLAGNTIVRQ